MDYELGRMTIGVLATIGLYTVLYRENKFYRFWEHVFLGLASGWAIVFLWQDVLYDPWYNKIIGKVAEADQPAQPGYWPWVFLLPIGIMGYFVFSKKHNWMSRVPIGIILGFWSGQQVQVWWREQGPQIADSIRPIFPTTTSSFTVPGTTGLPPEEAARIQSLVYPSEAISNLIFVITIISCLSYFLFSFDVKNRVLNRVSTTGRWLLMIGFGAIFGSTVMMRFTLLIDRMYFVWIEWLRDGVLRSMGGGGG
jgi:hypothetical protein